MNYDHKMSRLLLLASVLVASAHSVPILSRDEDDGEKVGQQELELVYENYTKEDLIKELLETKKQLNVSVVYEKTHTRRRRSTEIFEFPLDVCGTIPEVSYSYLFLK